MLSRAYKLRVRRRLRLQKRQVGELGAQAEMHLENNFFKRLERLAVVKRFLFSWVLLIALLTGSVVFQSRSLSSYYQTLQPVPGGTYAEGMLGSFTNANPVYATGLVDASVSKLIFAGLFTYDTHGQLVGDLANNFTVDDRGTTYTVQLKQGLTWHDSAPLTADDVVFTYQVIQNADAHSPLYTSWQGVTVTAKDAHTVVFALPNPLISFPYSMTNGIIPKHILGNVPMVDMRTNAFNTANPIGAGPFAWQAIQVDGGSADTRQEQIALKPFLEYHAGAPKLRGFVLRTFRNTERLIQSFERREVNAVVGLSEVPAELQRDPNIWAYNIPLTAQVMTFFRSSQGVLADAKVRQALVRAADTTAIIDDLHYPTLPVREPLLRGQVGYNPSFFQPDYDPVAASSLLDGQGWQLGADGLRRKDGTVLSFSLYAQSGGEYEKVARALQRQWRAVGIDARVVLQDEANFQNTLAYHGYDALLFGISVGSDSDVFVYWHSSQADERLPVRLNFSEYKSGVADSALEAGRTRSDPALRSAKYQPFLQAWQADAPALGLYQPRFLYVTHGPVYGLSERPINTDANRFDNVHSWMIREARKTPE